MLLGLSGRGDKDIAAIADRLWAGAAVSAAAATPSGGGPAGTGHGRRAIGRGSGAGHGGVTSGMAVG